MIKLVKYQSMKELSAANLDKKSKVQDITQSVKLMMKKLK